MVQKILITIICACISGIFNRMGGTSLGTKWRDIGVTLITIPLLAYLYGKIDIYLIGIYVLCAGLLFASLTTYFKKKGTDAHWYNWLFCGLAYSIAFLPFALYTGHLIGFVLRTVLLTGLTVAVSEFIDWDILEEWSRGFVITATLSLLLF